MKPFATLVASRQDEAVGRDEEQEGIDEPDVQLLVEITGTTTTSVAPTITAVPVTVVEKVSNSRTN